MMEQLYQQIILDHAKHKHGFGLLDDPTGESFQVNPTCGDQIRLQVRTAPGELEVVGWQGVGCSISQASASVLVDLVSGKSLDEVETVAAEFRALMDSRGVLTDGVEDVLEDATAFVGVAQYPARIKCALLGWMALREALLQAAASAPEEE